MNFLQLSTQKVFSKKLKILWTERNLLVVKQLKKCTYGFMAPESGKVIIGYRKRLVHISLREGATDENPGCWKWPELHNAVTRDPQWQEEEAQEETNVTEEGS